MENYQKLSIVCLKSITMFIVMVPYRQRCSILQLAELPFHIKQLNLKEYQFTIIISAKINTTCSNAALKAQLKQLLLRGDTF